MVMRVWSRTLPARSLERRCGSPLTTLAKCWDVKSHLGSPGIPLDIMESGDNIWLEASMPGFLPGDIDITFDNGLLTIIGENPKKEEVGHVYIMRERTDGNVFRSVALPDSIDVNRAKLSYDNGILSISFPKVEARKPKRLTLTNRKR